MGNVWIGTNTGLSIYQTATDKFTRLQYLPYGEKVTRTLNTETKDIKRTDDGTMLIASLTDGLLVYRN